MAQYFRPQRSGGNAVFDDFVPGGGSVAVPVGVAIEIDSALTLTNASSVIVSVGTAVEGDTAFSVTTAANTIIQVGTATEADTGLGVFTGVPVIVPIGGTTETDTAPSIAVHRADRVQVGRSSELDTGLPITYFDPEEVGVTPRKESDFAGKILAVTGGVLAQDVPGWGRNGPAFAFNEITLPEDTDKVVTYKITQYPSAGTFVDYPNTSFCFDGPIGAFTFAFDLWLDGDYQGNFTRTIQVKAFDTQNRWNGRLARNIYTVGDSLTSPSGGTDGVISYDTDGAGTISNIQIVNFGTGFQRNFRLSTRSINSAMAWFDITVSSGIITGVALVNQSAPFDANLNAEQVTVNNFPGVSSWAYKLWNEYALSDGSLIDAMPATSIARPGTQYQYNAPPALGGDIAIIALGSNDSGGIDLGGGIGPGGGSADLTQAEFITQFEALLDNFISDGYRVIIMTAAYNALNTINDDPSWIEATNLIRSLQRQVAATRGITEIWDFTTPELVDLLHPSAVGQEMMRQDLYPRMVAACGAQNLMDLGGPVPTTSVSPGKKGDVALDSTFLYLCVEDNNWRRFVGSLF